MEGDVIIMVSFETKIAKKQQPVLQAQVNPMQKSMKLTFVILITLLFSCGSRKYTTGWDYNNPNNGGFQKAGYFEQEVPPGMTLIEGVELGPFDQGLGDDSLIVSSFLTKGC